MNIVNIRKGFSSWVVFTLAVTCINCQKNITPNPSADFSSTSSPKGVVKFENLSTNANSYLWDFGDGATSTEKSPMHTYAAGGQYWVTLTSKANSTTSIQKKSINAFLNLGKLVFWMSSTNSGSFDIYVGGAMVGTLSNSASSSPACDASGFVAVSLAAGTYIWKAQGNVPGLTGEVDVANDTCSPVAIF
jgi:hypothetical protein